MRHELHLARRGLLVLAVALAPMTAIGAVVGGRAGAASVLAGAAIVAANQIVAVASTAWARRIGPGVIAVGYATFVARLAGVFTAFAWLASAGWAHRELVAGSFCAALVVTLGAEWRSWASGRFVPQWRLTSRAAETQGWRLAR